MERENTKSRWGRMTFPTRLQSLLSLKELFNIERHTRFRHLFAMMSSARVPERVAAFWDRVMVVATKQAVPFLAASASS
jgi:hypothetical protein